MVLFHHIYLTAIVTYFLNEDFTYNQFIKYETLLDSKLHLN